MEALIHMYLVMRTINTSDDFTAYVVVCFKGFGDRVLHWTNEFTLGGYDSGMSPLNHCSPPFGMRPCPIGNSSTEPYIAGHNLLLALSAVVRLYRRKYKSTKHGFVGLNLFAFWSLPYTNKTADVIAAQRANVFYLGWFVNPLVFGDYPDIMKKNAGSRLPKFTRRESKQVKGAIDFIALNYYMTVRVKDSSNSLENDIRDFTADSTFEFILKNGGTLPGQYPVTEPGLQGVLEYFKQACGNPPMYIHENGSFLFLIPLIHTQASPNAQSNGSNVKGYFTWSFSDCFELFNEYESAFGLYYVDLNDNELTRYPKGSARWYSNFLKGKGYKNSDKLLHSSQ
ncbi:hypothetical protein R3W88_000969 [Solanum pinnatisectum]|uniref:Uncharacterized protein n=1 Tax=Solanum pinnatisectum TaxID=50273 RepID=A0AAV9MGX4_9SOLN|nr:hypothetical protein R3W88_000969 [Solanum pinnatisectum]